MATEWRVVKLIGDQDHQDVGGIVLKEEEPAFGHIVRMVEAGYIRPNQEVSIDTLTEGFMYIVEDGLPLYTLVRDKR